MSAVTIQDIARQAGVCIGTVSRVINNKDRVRPETRRRIQQIIDKTGYRPSALGRGLVTHQSYNVMLLLHNIADPHCVSVAKHLTRCCWSRGYRLLIADSDYEPALEAECLRNLQDRSADGLIVSPLAGRRNLDLYQRLYDSGLPMVAAMDRVPGTRIPCVKYDDVMAGRMATDYLLGRGHRHILFAGWHTEFQTVKDRYQGYVESHTGSGLQLRPDLRLQLPKSLSQARDTLAGTLRIDRPPTALLAENEMVALTCLNALRQLGRGVPESMAVVVFGDQLPEGMAPLPLTVVALPEEQLGERAMELLFLQMEPSAPRPATAIVEAIRPQLIIRQSA